MRAESGSDESELTERERLGIRLELVVVLIVTFGLSGMSAALSLVESALSPGGVGGQTMKLNPSRSAQSVLDLLFQLLGVLRLLGWAALGLYLLWRSGIGPKAIGLARRVRWRQDVLPGLGLAALIGIPGLGLYLTAHALGMSVTIVPASLGEHWWRLPVLVLAACANAAAEEILVVGYLLTRLRRLGWTENRSLFASALLRGSYHLYQGVGGGIGNVVMGVIFARFWQRTNRLWPLVLAHATIDTVAYVGYTFLHGHVSWLP
ncbi:CPBP family intramembrane glutamic endopeptidase [Nocardia goodfellowii]|uniref:Membrane protease YdiL (CAAX protease family) n=1 Tax=Nocardia goodfellowii TaxID=882446 RepID=A0ABS4Q8Y1_9NOCA|nr:CPBP family intramembrane glutamic endopeptidase [Nocardia goodfellowii]MBP2188147.1 membrane protease YdiL (CAAX protease family) [Nocardia goodfellowii]